MFYLKTRQLVCPLRPIRNYPVNDLINKIKEEEEEQQVCIILFKEPPPLEPGCAVLCTIARSNSGFLHINYGGRSTMGGQGI